MTTVIDPGGISGLSVTNITGNGHNVHYNSDLSGNSYLGGLTYSLINGGYLTPGSVTGSEQLQSGNTSDIILYQNFPNPASSSTAIPFSILEKTFVTIKVYDQFGRQVVFLVDSDKEAGRNEISFDVSTIENGTYFYGLTASGTVRTMKMIILK